MVLLSLFLGLAQQGLIRVKWKRNYDLVRLYLFWFGDLIFINMVVHPKICSQLYVVSKITKFFKKLLGILNIIQ